MMIDSKLSVISSNTCGILAPPELFKLIKAGNYSWFYTEE